MENKYLRTTYERTILLSDIEHIRTILYHKSEEHALSTVLHKEIGEFSYELLSQLFIDKGINIDTVTIDEFERLIDEIQNEIIAYREIRLTIAIDPSNDFLNKLLDKVKEMTGQNSIINLRIDKSIIGGAIVSIDGKYTNYSISKKISAYYDKKRQLMNEHREIKDLFNIKVT